MQRMTDEKMLAQRAQLRELAETSGMALLQGTELNIAPDGSVDWDEDFLRGFDMRVASVQTENPISNEVSAGRGPVVSGRDHRRPNEGGSIWSCIRLNGCRGHMVSSLLI
jgi:hypothetical protein